MNKSELTYYTIQLSSATKVSLYFTTDHQAAKKENIQILIQVKKKKKQVKLGNST